MTDTALTGGAGNFKGWSPFPVTEIFVHWTTISGKMETSTNLLRKNYLIGGFRFFSTFKSHRFDGRDWRLHFTLIVMCHGSGGYVLRSPCWRLFMFYRKYHNTSSMLRRTKNSANISIIPTDNHQCRVFLGNVDIRGELFWPLPCVLRQKNRNIIEIQLSSLIFPLINSIWWLIMNSKLRGANIIIDIAPNWARADWIHNMISLPLLLLLVLWANLFLTFVSFILSIRSNAIPLTYAVDFLLKPKQEMYF